MPQKHHELMTPLSIPQAVQWGERVSPMADPIWPERMAQMAQDYLTCLYKDNRVFMSLVRVFILRVFSKSLY